MRCVDSLRRMTFVSGLVSQQLTIECAFHMQSIPLANEKKKPKQLQPVGFQTFGFWNFFFRPPKYFLSLLTAGRKQSTWQWMKRSNRFIRPVHWKKLCFMFRLVFQHFCYFAWTWDWMRLTYLRVDARRRWWTTAAVAADGRLTGRTAGRLQSVDMFIH